MKNGLREDYESLNDGDVIVLHPRRSNPITKLPREYIFIGGYYYQKDGMELDPDYYFGDVHENNVGFQISPGTESTREESND